MRTWLDRADGFVSLLIYVGVNRLDAPAMPPPCVALPLPPRLAVGGGGGTWCNDHWERTDFSHGQKPCFMQHGLNIQARIKVFSCFRWNPDPGDSLNVARVT